MNSQGRNKTGFTLAELLLTIAIVGILTAISIVFAGSFRMNKKYKENNARARQIYIVAQNNLSLAKANGTYDTIAKAIVNDGKQLIDKPSDFIGDPYKKEEFYTVSNTDPVTKLILPAGSIEDDIVKQGQYIIEINERLGYVYSVFYTESDTNTLTNNNKYRDQKENQVKDQEFVVGYYGGGNIPNNTSVKLEAPEVRIENGDELKLIINPKNPLEKPGIIIKCLGKTSNKTYFKRLRFGRYTLDGSNEYTVILDSYEAYYKHFGYIFEDAGLLPGEDIEVSVSVVSSKNQSIPATTTITTNSLFDTVGKVEVMNGSTKENEYQLGIKCIRHLQNLSAFDSQSIDDKYKGMTVAGTLLNDITYTDDAMADEYFQGIRNIDKNSKVKFTKFHGNQHVINNLEQVKGSTRNKAGLFGEVKDLEIDHVFLCNPEMQGSRYSGALVGIGENVKISYCGAYASDHATYVKTGIDNLSYGYWSDSVCGGLVGKLMGNSTIEESFSSLVVHGGIAGGLVGMVEGDSVTIRNSYCGGNLGDASIDDQNIHYERNKGFNIDSAHCTGGFIGSIQGGSNITLDHVYTTASVKVFSGCTGGFVGRVTDDCNINIPNNSVVYCANYVGSGHKNGYFVGEGKVPAACKYLTGYSYPNPMLKNGATGVSFADLCTKLPLTTETYAYHKDVYANPSNYDQKYHQKYPYPAVTKTGAAVLDGATGNHKIHYGDWPVYTQVDCYFGLVYYEKIDGKYYFSGQFSPKEHDNTNYIEVFSKDASGNKNFLYSKNTFVEDSGYVLFTKDKAKNTDGNLSSKITKKDVFRKDVVELRSDRFEDTDLKEAVLEDLVKQVYGNDFDQSNMWKVKSMYTLKYADSMFHNGETKMMKHETTVEERQYFVDHYFSDINENYLLCTFKDDNQNEINYAFNYVPFLWDTVRAPISYQETNGEVVPKFEEAPKEYSIRSRNQYESLAGITNYGISFIINEKGYTLHQTLDIDMHDFKTAYQHGDYEYRRIGVLCELDGTYKGKESIANPNLEEMTNKDLEVMEETYTIYNWPNSIYFISGIGDQGKLSNLTVINQKETEYDHWHGLIGTNNGIIENVRFISDLPSGERTKYFYFDTISTNPSHMPSALFCETNNNTISNCYIEGFEGSTKSVNGLIGRNNGRVEHVYARNIKAQESGFVAENNGTIDDCYMIDCYADGAGIVNNNLGTIRNTYFLNSSAKNGIMKENLGVLDSCKVLLTDPTKPMLVTNGIGGTNSGTITSCEVSGVNNETINFITSAQKLKGKYVSNDTINLNTPNMIGVSNCGLVETNEYSGTISNCSVKNIGYMQRNGMDLELKNPIMNAGFVGENSGSISNPLVASCYVQGNGIVQSNSGTITGNKTINPSIQHCVIGGSSIANINSGTLSNIDVINSKITGTGAVENNSGSIVGCQIYSDKWKYEMYLRTYLDMMESYWNTNNTDLIHMIYEPGNILDSYLNTAAESDPVSAFNNRRNQIVGGEGDLYLLTVIGQDVGLDTYQNETNGFVQDNTGTIKDSSVTGYFVGDLSINGFVNNTSNSIDNCYVNGKYLTNANMNANVNGFVKMLSGNITNSFVLGQVINPDQDANGFVQSANNATINQCYTILKNGSDDSTEFIPFNRFMLHATVSNCFDLKEKELTEANGIYSGPLYSIKKVEPFSRLLEYRNAKPYKQSLNGAEYPVGTFGNPITLYGDYYTSHPELRGKNVFVTSAVVKKETIQGTKREQTSFNVSSMTIQYLDNTGNVVTKTLTDLGDIANLDNHKLDWNVLKIDLNKLSERFNCNFGAVGTTLYADQSGWGKQPCYDAIYLGYTWRNEVFTGIRYFGPFQGLVEDYNTQGNQYGDVVQTLLDQQRFTYPAGSIEVTYNDERKDATCNVLNQEVYGKNEFTIDSSKIESTVNKSNPNYYDYTITIQKPDSFDVSIIEHVLFNEKPLDVDENGIEIIYDYDQVTGLKSTLKFRVDMVKEIKESILKKVEETYPKEDYKIMEKEYDSVLFDLKTKLDGLTLDELKDFELTDEFDELKNDTDYVQEIEDGLTALETLKQDLSKPEDQTKFDELIHTLDEMIQRMEDSTNVDIQNKGSEYRTKLTEVSNVETEEQKTIKEIDEKLKQLNNPDSTLTKDEKKELVIEVEALLQLLSTSTNQETLDKVVEYNKAIQEIKELLGMVEDLEAIKQEIEEKLLELSGMDRSTQHDEMHALVSELELLMQKLETSEDETIQQQASAYRLKLEEIKQTLGMVEDLEVIKQEIEEKLLELSEMDQSTQHAEMNALVRELETLMQKLETSEDETIKQQASTYRLKLEEIKQTLGMVEDLEVIKQEIEEKLLKLSEMDQSSQDDEMHALVSELETLMQKLETSEDETIQHEVQMYQAQLETIRNALHASEPIEDDIQAIQEGLMELESMDVSTSKDEMHVLVNELELRIQKLETSEDETIQQQAATYRLKLEEIKTKLVEQEETELPNEQEEEEPILPSEPEENEDESIDEEVDDSNQEETEESMEETELEETELEDSTLEFEEPSNEVVE